MVVGLAKGTGSRFTKIDPGSNTNNFYSSVPDFSLLFSPLPPAPNKLIGNMRNKRHYYFTTVTHKDPEHTREKCRQSTGLFPLFLLTSKSSEKENKKENGCFS